MVNVTSVVGLPERALLEGSPAAMGCDALVVVTPSPVAAHVEALGAEIQGAIAGAAKLDAALGGKCAPVVLAVQGVPGGRLVVAPMSALQEETDDVRSVAEAAAAAMTRAVAAGARRPLLFVRAPADPRFARAVEVATLAVLGTQWAALEARESEHAPSPAEAVAVLGLSEARARELAAIEVGRALCRDITAGDPERMAPRRVAELCEAAFARTGVGVKVERNVEDYPLLSAVARASRVVERHKPCVVRLDYRPKGEIKRTVLLAGKGVTYDTGGADLKTDGHMAGMSRDKGGAGAVAGVVRAAAALGLEGVRVVGILGLVRNSVGEESFVSDEVIRSRAGVRVRIGNTDAEGRLVLADLLAVARELATAGAVDPVVFSVATLTGHVYRAHGPYVGALSNGAGRKEIARLAEVGEQWAEPFEHVRPRREDYALIAPRTPAEDVVSANRLASVNTPRGHQFPFAFMDVASGMKGSALPFTHLDIGGVVCEGADWQFGRPTGTPVTSFIGYLKGGASEA
ncbi:aminopeptidase [Chondromyces apiculatus]|uniref:Cytosol aminopeptidase PepA n=1 Tax=Chondromyces apiculatus DSM 436 TaxID=1192034 RepID=A0A017T898_9BACT|nr:aminopeptidase [Chondromyces apiculatus]EYF04826.1 Cytosol aminopeptidase PepA [Chondromyces apiculatus DSM 436]